MFNRLNKNWSRRLISIGFIGITTITIRNLIIRYNDLIEEKEEDEFVIHYNDLIKEEDNEFIIHTNNEQRKHWLSGMHQPFVTKDIKELNLFDKYFNEFQFLIKNNFNEIKENPVYIKSFSEYKNEKINYSTSTLIVGGLPALINSISLIQNKENIIYLNDFKQIPISNGSAYHLEEDAQTEAPTDYQPITFFYEQIKRILLMNVTFKKINETGQFPWRTIDWIQWIRHPEHWLRALNISLQFQLFTMVSNRTNLLNDVGNECHNNEFIYNQLNQILDNKLLYKDNGSIILARNQQEIKDLNQLKINLNKENRFLNILSNDEILNRYGFLPNAKVFGEKIHDRILNPNFFNLIKEFILKHNQLVFDGTLKTIYINKDDGGGIALFINNQNQQEIFIKFNRCILSLGNQQIFNENKKRLFDVISARGVSILAHVYLPQNFKFPPVVVCGGTNHVTKLSSPKSINNYDLYLMRFTAGACITPNLSDEFTSYYDSTIAFGLIESIKKCLGNEIMIKPLFIYGCNRQVSQYGQIHWIEPYKNIFIQYGAAGGGLTRAPGFLHHFSDKK